MQIRESLFQLVFAFLHHASGGDHLRALLFQAKQLGQEPRIPLRRDSSRKPQVLTTKKSAASMRTYALIARFEQQADHHLAVDEIAGAAQTRKVKFILEINSAVQHSHPVFK